MNQEKSPGVSKSFYDAGKSNPVLQYCISHSSEMHPVQKKLIEETVKHKRAAMMGAPEVVALNGALIKAIGAKKVLDIGVFTGASSLAAGLALPADGKVVACDTSNEFVNIARQYWKDAGIMDKIDVRIAPALDTLNELINNGEGDTFDFAFIDADKPNYDNYYELCLKLLRSRGMIALDNTLWDGKVLNENPDPNDVDTVCIKKLNEKIRNDQRVTAVLLNVGDGWTCVVKN